MPVVEQDTLINLKAANRQYNAPYGAYGHFLSMKWPWSLETL